LSCLKPFDDLLKSHFADRANPTILFRSHLVTDTEQNADFDRIQRTVCDKILQDRCVVSLGFIEVAIQDQRGNRTALDRIHTKWNAMLVCPFDWFHVAAGLPGEGGRDFPSSKGAVLIEVHRGWDLVVRYRTIVIGIKLGELLVGLSSIEVPARIIRPGSGHLGGAHQYEGDDGGVIRSLGAGTLGTHAVTKQHDSIIMCQGVGLNRLRGSSLEQ